MNINIYLFVVLILALYLTLKFNTYHKFIVFLIIYWILTGSYLNIDIKTLPFDFRLSRIIFIVFSIYLLLNWLSGMAKKRNVREKIKFEKFLYFFILVTIIIIAIHMLSMSTIKELIIFATKLLTPLVIYLVLREITNKEIIKIIIQSILIVCTISSIISIYQFFGDPLFLRVGIQRIAFGGLFRANGVFNAEYIQAYFLVIGVFFVLFSIRGPLLKYGLVLLFLTGLVLTFHRMSWIVMIILTILYFIEVKSKKVLHMIALGVIIIACLSLFHYRFFSISRSGIDRSSFVQERLIADTISGRVSIGETVLNEIPDNWIIGIGGTKSDVFYNAVLDAGWSEAYAIGEGGAAIHNEYLLVGFFYGLPALFLFCAFLISALIFFWKKSHKKK